MQNTLVFSNNKRSRFKQKNYKFKSGNVVKIQGYENLALDILLKTYNENDIITKSEEVPKIKYYFQGKNRVYYPDLFIPIENKIIEVKSTYTYNIKIEQNLIKRDKTLKSGYNFEFWIFDNKGNLEIK